MKKCLVCENVIVDRADLNLSEPAKPRLPEPNDGICFDCQQRAAIWAAVQASFYEKNRWAEREDVRAGDVYTRGTLTMNVVGIAEDGSVCWKDEKETIRWYAKASFVTILYAGDWDRKRVGETTSPAPVENYRTQVTEGTAKKGGLNPPNTSDSRPPAPSGSGGKVEEAGPDIKLATGQVWQHKTADASLTIGNVVGNRVYYTLAVGQVWKQLDGLPYASGMGAMIRYLQDWQLMPYAAGPSSVARHIWSGAQLRAELTKPRFKVGQLWLHKEPTEPRIQITQVAGDAIHYCKYTASGYSTELVANPAQMDVVLQGYLPYEGLFEGTEKKS